MRKGWEVIIVNKTKIYLSSEKACYNVAVLLVAERYVTKIGSELKPGSKTKRWYVEIWREE